MSPPLDAEQAARVERHTELVRRVARQVARETGVMPVDELESVGNEALVRSAMRYDPTSPASFATYAHYRVRGAMIDAIRKRTPARRKHQRALTRLEASQELLSQAAEDQAAIEANTRQTLEQRVEAARALVRRTTLAMCLTEPEGRALDRVVADGPDPEQLLVDADTRARVWASLDRLDPDERALIEALYVQGETMGEIAAREGVSKATISRRHTRLLDRLGKGVRGELGSGSYR